MPRKKKEEEILEVQEEVSDTVSDSGNDVLSAMTGQASQAGFGLAAGSGKKQAKSEAEQLKSIEEITKRLKKEGTLNAYKKPLTPLTDEEIEKAEEERLKRLKAMQAKAAQENVEDEPADDENKQTGGSAEDAEPKELDEPEEANKTDGNSQKESNKYEVTGILDTAEGGFGFLRFDNFLTSSKDVYVSPTQIRRFNLKTGDEIFGIARPPKQGEKFGALLFVTKVNGDDPGVAIKRPKFEDLTPIFPTERLTLETSRQQLATRLIDLIAPIGKGQRGLIAAPPKAGKTTLLKNIANAIESRYKDIDPLALLIDERP